jgi:hypothetical protein
MSENTNEDAVEVKPTAKKTTSKKTTAKKAAPKKTTTDKVAESVDAITTSAFQEAETKTEDGQEVITGPSKPKPSRSSNTRMDDNNVVGSRSADRALNEAKKEEAPEKVVDNEEDRMLVHSQKNIRWQGVGTLSPGYNVVTKEAAEKWLTRQGIREASAEEVATYYGN